VRITRSKHGAETPSRRRTWISPAAVVHQTDAPALLVRDLTVSFKARPALSKVSFELRRGQKLAVAGPNGAGKSTLLKALVGLLPPSRGSIEIHGHAPQGHICIAYVPQRTDVDWRFPVTVRDVVMMGRTGRLGPLRRPGIADQQTVSQALRSVNLEALAGHPIHELSGGQQQRMFIARAIAQEAEIVLMDEPFAGLDVHSRDEVLAILDGLHDVTLLVALHDLSIAASHFDRVLLLNQNAVGFGTPSEVFTPDTLKSAYGSCLRMVKTDEGLLVVHDTSCTGET